MIDILTLRADEPDVFVRVQRSGAKRRLFGGEILAQAVVAAGGSDARTRPLAGIRADFLRAGDSDRPVAYAVDRVRDGGSFTTRNVQARQDGRLLATLTTSAHALETGLESPPETLVVAPPEDLPPPDEYFADDRANLAWIRALLARNPVDCRFVDRPVRADAARGIPSPSRQRVWIRVTDDLPDDDLLQRAALAYASDLFLLATSVAPHGRTIQDADMQFATLDHTVWFHARPRTSLWMLYDQSAVWTGAGRALCTGEFRDRDGVLLASVAQQALIRLRPSKEYGAAGG